MSSLCEAGGVPSVLGELGERTVGGGGPSDQRPRKARQPG